MKSTSNDQPDQYDFKVIEPKWQQRWAKEQAHATGDPAMKPKRYVLGMFPYPSGQGLHIGHSTNYTATDVMARYLRLKGFAVLHPIGWDAFGLPAENYAIKQGVPPAVTTAKNIATFKQQLNRLGFSYDWERELNTSSPEYFRWTQWLFAELFKAGLAYQKEAAVNWCEHDQTVLANEQVVEGKCERCGQPVIQKKMKQWFFKITEYADRLLAGLNDLDWPEFIKTSQRNWIGKSVGAEVIFKIADTGHSVTVFTTRVDTLFGATYLVLAPEHELVDKITTAAQRAAVTDYQRQAAAKSELTRTQLTKEKTGVFTGAYAINPVNHERLPVWVADYVVSSYGTGAIMAVPAHDERDFAFARTYKLPIKPVVKKTLEQAKSNLVYSEPGILANSGEYSGLTSEAAQQKIAAALAKQQQGRAATTYRLRDWLISRQRYWGAPIPIIHCPACGPVLVPTDQLPVELPTDVDFHPHGHSPLADSVNFLHVACPQCGGPAERETDTMDTFVCSSWYYLRYASPHNDQLAFAEADIKTWLPVDMYVGGAEHAVLHLLYARFFTKFLFDQKRLTFEEPFTSLKNVGIILGPDHRKMSKSLGNVINPDEIIIQYGADALRLHALFLGPFADEKPWSTAGITGITRFLTKVWAVIIQTTGDILPNERQQLAPVIQKMAEDTAVYGFNTAIASIMGFINSLGQSRLSEPAKRDILIILFPYAPHITSELWERVGSGKLYEQAWPAVAAADLVVNTVTIAVQVNGKLRGDIQVAPDASTNTVTQRAKEQPNVARHLAGKQIIKEIVIPNRLVNFVVDSAAISD